MNKIVYLLGAAVLGMVPIARGITVDYTTIANGTYPSVSLGGTTVTGSSTVTSGFYAGFQGLGITGGGADISLDVGETMTINLGMLATGVNLTFVDIDPPGNVTFGFQAFNGVTSLGSFACPYASTEPQTYNLTALAGGLSMSSFTIYVTDPSPPLGLQIQGVSFNPATVPDSASTVALLGLTCLCLFAVAHRQCMRQQSADPLS